jgi:hypothetical protein
MVLVCVDKCTRIQMELFHLITKGKYSLPSPHWDAVSAEGSLTLATLTEWTQLGLV